jgi:hypothetical protein
MDSPAGAPRARVRPEHLRLAVTLLGLAVAAVGLGIGAHSALHGHANDFNCFHDAAAAVVSGGDIYASGGYIYPPLLAVLLSPLGLLNQHIAALIWAVLIAALTVVVAYLAARNAADGLRNRADTQPIWSAAWLAILVLASTLFQEYRDGNCDMLILLAVVLAQRWLARRPVLSGLALGLAINIKYLPLVYLPYLLIRRRWAALASACLSTILAALAPAAIFGWDHNLKYLRAAYAGLFQMVGGQAQGAAANIHPLAWRNSISLPSVLARAAQAAHLPQPAVWAGTLLLIAAVVAICWKIYQRERIPLLIGRCGATDDKDPTLRAMASLEWPALMVAALIFSPQTVPRHVNMALPFMAAGEWLLLSGSIPAAGRLIAAFIAVFVGTFFRLWLDRPDGPLEPWRGIGGLSWCLLLAAFAVLDQGAVRARSVAGTRDISSPEA